MNKATLNEKPVAAENEEINEENELAVEESVQICTCNGEMEFNLWPLITELGDGRRLSLGRVAFWIIFGFCTYFWFYIPPTLFPDTLFYTLSFLMVYNISKKTMKPLEQILGAWASKRFGSASNTREFMEEVVGEVRRARDGEKTTRRRPSSQYDEEDERPRRPRE